MIDFILYLKQNMEKIKKSFSNPIVSWIGGISIGTIFTFALVLGGYKESFDTIKEDVKTTKTDIQQIKIDVAVLKTKQEEIYKK